MPERKSTKNSSPKAVPATQEWLLDALEKLHSGKSTVAETMTKLSVLPYEEIGYAKIDHHRTLRKGFPEVIFGQGKTVEQIVSIAEHILKHSDRLLVTRSGQEAFNLLKTRIPDALYNPLSGTIVVNRNSKLQNRPGITVACGGTADIPVAEEAVVTAEIMGNEVEKVFDIGVAGIHRLLDKVTILRQSRVIVVVAGMEGALPSVIGGLVSIPVIAVPTSVGYGAHFNGLAPLLTMLNSCAPGVAVVNIDNGFGAGYLAGLINMEQDKGE
jgi:pyridinium-3,5-biscarboxylic acid mononucleotide synthase